MKPTTGDTERWLIVNADDFGQSRAINRGTIAAIERGIVTSASLMVCWPASTEAANYACQHASLSLGLHVDFGEWAYRDGQWVTVYQRAQTDDAVACLSEVSHQLDIFCTLTGRNPTHVDSHQHVHREEPLRSVLIDVAARLGIAVRHFDPAVRYDGSFYGQSGRGYPLPRAIEVDALVNLIETLPAGLTELGCHPGEIDDTLDSMYRVERALELSTLCDPRVRAAIQSAAVRLCSFRDVQAGFVLGARGTHARQ